jgi:hypothetical protein
VIEIPCIDILDMSVVTKGIVVHLSDTGLEQKKTNSGQEFEPHRLELELVFDEIRRVGVMEKARVRGVGEIGKLTGELQ